MVDEGILIQNMRSFIYDHVVPKFNKNIVKPLDKLLICKEDKEQLTKSKIALITQLFLYLNSLDEKALSK